MLLDDAAHNIKPYSDSVFVLSVQDIFALLVGGQKAHSG